MAKFRSPKSEAKYLIAKHNGIGTPRHGNKKDGKIHSFRTADNYSRVIENFLRWLSYNAVFSGLNNITGMLAEAYLEERSEEIVQSSLDVERLALELVLSTKLRKIKSTKENPIQQRCYSPQQSDLIISHQSKRNAFSTKLSRATGVRAHELLTIQYSEQRPASSHRKWSDMRFHEMSDFIHMTVCGKGGLVREIAVPNVLHNELIKYALKAPKKIIDRKVYYTSYYDIGGGQAWAQSFSSASKRVLGWSCGAHCLRHEYARSRMETLQRSGLNYFEARKIVSQEMGHFRGTITEVYLK